MSIAQAKRILQYWLLSTKNSTDALPMNMRPGICDCRKHHRRSAVNPPKNLPMLPLDAVLGKLAFALVDIIAGKVSRKEFLSELSRMLLRHFHFDRLCINLYDNNDGMLSFFTNAQGMVVSTLSPVRSAEENNTVAGYIIAARRAVVITDFAKYFPLPNRHPFEEAGLKASIAIPLFLSNEIIGTFHCSFAEPPRNIQEIFHFLAPLCKVIAPCLGAILSTEQKTVIPQLPHPHDSGDTIPHKSAIMKELIREANAVAAYDIPVMLLGETGAGKSMLAQYIHQRSKRRESRFVKVNCPSFSPFLFESEFFGHSKGAFTGAFNKRIGRFELAHTGTLFLDEISGLSPEMQSKLLQVIEESRFERVGESNSLAVDIRLLSATNSPVEQDLATRTMRSDLFHRLSAYIINVPPLRERKEDIPVYVKTFALEAEVKAGVHSKALDKRQIRALMDYDWPGNLRELKNVVNRLLLMRQMGKELAPSVIHEMLDKAQTQNEQACDTAPRRMKAESSESIAVAYAGSHAERTLTLEQMERGYILAVLEKTKWVVSGPRGAAKLLGLPRSTLLSRMKKLGMQHRPE